MKKYKKNGQSLGLKNCQKEQKKIKWEYQYEREEKKYGRNI